MSTKAVVTRLWDIHCPHEIPDLGNECVYDCCYFRSIECLNRRAVGRGCALSLLPFVDTELKCETALVIKGKRKETLKDPAHLNGSFSLSSRRR